MSSSAPATCADCVSVPINSGLRFSVARPGRCSEASFLGAAHSTRSRPIGIETVCGPTVVIRHSIDLHPGTEAVATLVLPVPV